MTAVYLKSKQIYPFAFARHLFYFKPAPIIREQKDANGAYWRLHALNHWVILPDYLICSVQHTWDTVILVLNLNAVRHDRWYDKYLNPLYNLQCFIYKCKRRWSVLPQCCLWRRPNIKPALGYMWFGEYNIYCDNRTNTVDWLKGDMIKSNKQWLNVRAYTKVTFPKYIFNATQLGKNHHFFI